MNDSSLSEKTELINGYFSAVIGKKFLQFETAQILYDDGDWDDWNERPIRLYFSEERIVSVSWSKFDDLWLASDKSLRSGTSGGSGIRWIANGRPQLLPLLGRSLSGVWLGGGDVYMEGRSLNYWTRLLLDFNGNWLEIYNALDENGYELHDSKPRDELIKCT